MMRSSALQLAVLVLMTGALLSGCTHAPIQEMSDARQALQAAREAGAGAYARPTLAQAEGELTEAEGAIKTDQFDLARTQALAAKDGAGTARRVALSMRSAETAVSAADRVGATDHGGHALLEQARAAAAAGDPGQAMDLADRARLEGERASDRRYLETAWRLLHEAEGRLAAMGPEDRARYEAALVAANAQDGRRAYELARAFEGTGAPASARDPHRRKPSAAQPE